MTPSSISERRRAKPLPVARFAGGATAAAHTRPDRNGESPSASDHRPGERNVEKATHAFHAPKGEVVIHVCSTAGTQTHPLRSEVCEDR